MKRISVLIPAYNEEANLPKVFQRVSAVADGLKDKGYSFEMIVLDNNSRDATPELVRRQCEKDKRWKYLRYSRNFGAENSMVAGLDHADGDAVVTVFSDLQDPPEYIPEMLELWEKGGEVIIGVVKERSDSSIFKTLGASIGYKMIYHLTDCKIPPSATDFRLLDRKVVLALRQMREADRYLRGLVHWVGFRQVFFTYNRNPRVEGGSAANLLYCVKFALHAVVCFSSKPIHFAVLFGFFLTAASLLLSIVYLFLYFVRPPFLPTPPPGVATLILLALFISGTQSLFLGIIGEYVGRIYNQGKQRPLYLVDEKLNF